MKAAVRNTRELESESLAFTTDYGTTIVTRGRPIVVITDPTEEREFWHAIGYDQTARPAEDGKSSNGAA